MKPWLVLAILSLPALAGCDVLFRPAPTLAPFTQVPELIATIAPTETPNPTATLAPTPTSAPTNTPPAKKPAEVTPTATLGVPARRVQFATGAITSTIQGNLTANKIDYYVLRALGGQTMTVVATSTQGNVLLQISGADGNPLKSMAVGGPRWSGVLPSTQDYVIAISSESGAPASYTLQITIPPLAK